MLVRALRKGERPAGVIHCNPNGNVAGALLEIENDAELRTIYYALAEYKKNLLADIDGLENTPKESRVSDNLEEETFLHGEVAKVSKLMFEIAYDHDTETANEVRGWMGL